MTQSAAVIAGGVIALLVICGVWALFAGLRARAEAAGIGETNRQLAALVSGSPAQAMLVRADGRIELPRRLGDWLGFEDLPRDLAELTSAGAGLVPEDADALGVHVAAAHKAGKPFSLSVRARGSERALLVVGERAPQAINAPGGVILWFLDATDSQAEINRLQREATRLRAAFEDERTEG